jgi:hypothetical protein
MAPGAANRNTFIAVLYQAARTKSDTEINKTNSRPGSGRCSIAKNSLLPFKNKDSADFGMAGLQAFPNLHAKFNA